MKRFFIILILFLCLFFFIPYLVIYNFSGFYIPPNEKKAETYESILVYVKDEDKVLKMDMSQYLKEAVSAEMPAEFELEALKAQATAARTYLVNRKNAKNEDAKNYHKGADICTDSTHCKAWISEEARRKSWGEEKQDEYWEKISQAVEDTAGVLITYNDTPISAVYHSTSSGFTENAVDVWGNHVPYLVSVQSKGEEASPRYRSECTLSIEEFKSIAEAKFSDLDWNSGLVGEIERSDAGGIKTIEIGGRKISGAEFRTLYSLRSTNANISLVDDSIYIDVTGFGHGVGMSQYGANYLASTGMNYKEILKSYYTGVEVL